MSKFYLVCKQRTNGSKCSMAITSDTKEDLLAAALEHASSVHDLKETRGLKDSYRGSMKKGAPPA
jgi:hypothetical protein